MRKLLPLLLPLDWETRLPEDLFLGISRPGVALRSAMDPVSGVLRAGALGEAREAGLESVASKE
jgi:hypothetical protein